MLRAKIKWKKWFYTLNRRKVNKCNHISYRKQIFEFPSDSFSVKNDIFKYEDKKNLLLGEIADNLPIYDRNYSKK
ncbi:MAG: hypothetical protein ACTSQP_14350 [Promethearchaeota archaeon]